MKIKQDPITKLWCREDGAILMPPTGYKFKKFRWTFGSNDGNGYKAVMFQGKNYKAHQIICRAFNGLPPEDKPFVDHIDRCRSNNTPGNLHWTSVKENADNQGKVDQALEKYGVRACENVRAYKKAYREAHREERKST